MTIQEIEVKAKELKEWQRLAEEATEAATALQDEIKATMSSTNVDTLIAGAFKITWKSVESSRLDTAALKKELPELAERYTKSSVTRRFIVA